MTEYVYTFVASHLYSGALSFLLLVTAYYLLREWVSLEKFPIIWVAYFATLTLPLQKVLSRIFSAPTQIIFIKIKENGLSKVFEVIDSSSEKNLLLQMWVFGFVVALLFTFYSLYRSYQFGRRINTIQVLHSDIQQKFKDFSLRIVDSPLVGDVFVFGYFRQTIFIPASIFEELSAEEIDSVIWHEVKHFKSRDNLLNLIVRFVVCLYWFFPPVYLSYFFLRRSQEIAADSFALENLGKEAQLTYAKAFLKMALKNSRIELISYSHFFNQNYLTRRLKMIKSFKHRTWKSSIIPFGIILSFSTLALAVSTKSPGEDKVYEIKMDIIENGSIKSSPRVRTRTGEEALIVSTDSEGSFVRLKLLPETLGDEHVKVRGEYCGGTLPKEKTKEQSMNLSEEDMMNLCKSGDNKKLMMEVALHKKAEMTIGQTTFRFVVQ